MTKKEDKKSKSDDFEIVFFDDWKATEPSKTINLDEFIQNSKETKISQLSD